MGFDRVTVEDYLTVLFDEKGGFVSLTGHKDCMRVLLINTPENSADDAAELISAAETETVVSEKNRIICDYLKSNEMMTEALSKRGFELTDMDSVVSVKTQELVSSAGVQKSLRMKFPGVDTYAFSDLMTFQKDEVFDFLEKLHYPIDRGDLDEVDQSISAVTYDDEYEVVAVLLASCVDDSILVELMVGFSPKKPHYIMSVCQQFISGIMSGKLAEKYPNVRMITLNESVIPLIRRLLDKNYEITTEDVIIHAQKDVSEGNEEITDDAGRDISGEPYTIDKTSANINAKYTWKSNIKKGK